MKRPLFSGSGSSPWANGPRQRTMSPDGSSTLITSAPRSAISLVANAAEIPAPHSTTRRPCKIPWLGKSPLNDDLLIAAIYHEMDKLKNKTVGFSREERA